MAKGAVKTADQAASNWKAAMTGGQAAAKYKQGIQGYQGNPMQAAASPEAQALYAQNTAQAVSSGRMAQALNSVDPGLWKANALQYGATNLAQGAAKGAGKYAAKAQKLQAVWGQQRAAVQGMPKGGSANAKARMSAALDIMMSAFGKS